MHTLHNILNHLIKVTLSLNTQASSHQLNPSESRETLHNSLQISHQNLVLLLPNKHIYGLYCSHAGLNVATVFVHLYHHKKTATELHQKRCVHIVQLS